MRAHARCQCRRRPRRGPRGLDPHQAAGVTDATLKRYRKAVLGFALFLAVYFPFLETPEDFDDGVVEYKQHERISKSDFENLLAAIEFLMPQMKGALVWSHAILKGWRVHHRPQHTVPMSRAHARLRNLPRCRGSRSSGDRISSPARARPQTV